ncbi:hypothetical protein BH11PLA2_BH11PLA2_22610 [soil metagenome]
MINIPQEVSVADAFNNETFCVLPWIHLNASEDGVWGRCCLDYSTYHGHLYHYSEKPVMNLNEDAIGCVKGSPFAKDNENRVYSIREAFNAPNLRETRVAMLRSERVEACKYCYMRESAGGVSMRTVMNRQFRERVDWYHLINATGDNGHLQEDPIFLDLRLGNHCNLSCVMCSYPISSKLHSTVDNSWLKGILDPYSDDATFWGEMAQLLPSIQKIYFAGGEPMLQKGHLRLLDMMVHSGEAKHIELSYNSNLTVLPMHVLECFKCFPSVVIGASCDGIGEVFERIRRGAKWERFVENVHLASRYAKVRLSVCVQKLNIHDIPNLLRWAISEDLEVDLFNILEYPEELSLRKLSDEIKERFRPHYFQLAKELRMNGWNDLAEQVDAIANALANNFAIHNHDVDRQLLSLRVINN